MTPRRALAALAALFLLAGCPGDSGGANSTPRPATGKASVNITWPAEKKIVLEAEDARLVAPMEILADAKASRGRCVIIPEGENFHEQHKAGIGRGTLEFAVPEDGDYTLWARVFFPHECADSFDANIDGGIAVGFQDSTHNAWIWIRPPGGLKFPLKKGQHALELVNREDGAMIDQLLLTIRPPDLYVPVGLEEAGG